MESRLSLPLETKFQTISASGDFVGMASTFGNIDLQGDIVAPGAFVRSLANHKSKKTSPAMLWHHRSDEPIGVWTSLKESSEGLEVTGQLSLGVQRLRLKILRVHAATAKGAAGAADDRGEGGGSNAGALSAMTVAIIIPS